MSRRGRGRRRPNYQRIASLEREVGMGDVAVAEKAVNPAFTRNPRGRDVMVSLTDVVNAMTTSQVGTGVAIPLPRDPLDLSPFGPMHGMPPSPIDPVNPRTGRPEPRLSEFEVGWNLPGNDYRLVPWTVLRSAARQIDIVRRCIELRKRHVAPLRWAWTVSEDAVEQALMSRRGAARADIEAELRERLQPEIGRLTAFWKRPWRANGLNFKQWASMLLEEHLVVDAVVVYPQMTYGGECLNMEIISGDTIKPLRDHRGALPRPPFPAFQQILYGFPRGEFTATVDDTPEGTVVPGGFAADQLYYYRGTPFANTPYGLSAVEQALISARLYLKRQGWLLSEYDDGVTPNTWLIPPANAADMLGEKFTVQKRREWEQGVNDELGGNTAARHRIKVPPPGFEPKQMTNIAEQFKPDFDYFLIRVLASHLDITLPELNITEPGGLGASGYHEGQEDVQNRIGTRPTATTLEDIVNDLSYQFLRAPSELTFKVLGLESEDEAAQDAVAQARVQTGRMTINEDRDRQGQPRYPFAEADKPMLMTQRGVVFLEGASQVSPPGELVMPVQDVSPGAATGTPSARQPAPAQDEADPQEPAAGGKTETEKAAVPDDPVRQEIAVKANSAAKLRELTAYRRWLEKHANPRRPFVLEHLTAEDVGPAPRSAVFKDADGGGAGPKAPGPRWPGWSVDAKAAAEWASRIADAFTGAVVLDGLVQVWQARGDQAPGRDRRELEAAAAVAANWLTAYGLQQLLTEAVRPMLTGVYQDGYWIGARCAQALISAAQGGSGAVNWGGWRPGTEQGVTRAFMDRLAADPAYDHLVGTADLTAMQIAHTRVEAIGMLLAKAAARGETTEQIAAAIRGYLVDPAMAYRVAITEIVKAQSAATVAAYQRAGVARHEWLDEPGACPICQANAAAGAIPIGMPFPSGDAAPGAHVGCHCGLGPVLTPV